MRTFPEIINEIKRIKNLKTDIDVAQVLKIKPKTFATAKVRNSIPFEELFSFCRKEGIDFDYLLNEEKEWEQEAGDYPFLSEGHPQYIEEFVTIPQVAGKIGAGENLVPDSNIDMRIAFRHDWISRKGDPQHMRLIRVKGDSMEPTLMDGDLLLVDLNRNYIEPPGGIYAIYMNDTIIAKRVQAIYPSGKLRIISDNPKYEPVDTDPDEVKVNGKVIWYARELER